jgi:hypothetical protein
MLPYKKPDNYYDTSGFPKKEDFAKKDTKSKKIIFMTDNR